jgi:hypothetical protein
MNEAAHFLKKKKGHGSAAPMSKPNETGITSALSRRFSQCRTENKEELGSTRRQAS